MFTARSRKGFTLIELLVVIAIIAILAAILFPVFAQARESARTTACISNLKQLDTAFQMYASDYDEHFPVWSWWASSPKSSGAKPGRANHFESLWINAIYPDVKSAQVYACPDDKSDVTPLNSSLYWWTDKNTVAGLRSIGIADALITQPLSYSIPEPTSGIDGWSGWGGPSQGHLPSFERPSSTMLIADGITSLQCCPYNGRPDPTNPKDIRHRAIMRRVAYANQCDGTWWGGDPTVAKPEWDTPDCERHRGGENIAFVDGHAKWRRVNQITDDLYVGDQFNGGG